LRACAPSVGFAAPSVGFAAPSVGFAAPSVGFAAPSPVKDGGGSLTTLAERLARAATQLAAAGIEDPRREARLLLIHATGLDGAALLQHLPSERAAPGYDALVARRAAHEPLALVIGHQPFWTLDLLVSPDTLIPRADSETLIDAALDACVDRPPPRVLDLGTGTGCLLLAALSEFPQAWGVGVDRAEPAARLARRNAERAGLGGRTAIVCADWATPLGGRFDLILSNPPYIETAAIASLMPEVARHEPGLALDGGADGLAAYRSLIAALPALLAPGAVAIFELGQGQGPAVADLARSAGLRPEAPRPDLAGIARALPIRGGP
jgi:release factor glutamine methyltransferase